MCSMIYEALKGQKKYIAALVPDSKVWGNQGHKFRSATGVGLGSDY